MGETHIIEYKSIWKDDWLEWICGFANAKGGIMEIGKDNDGITVGLPGIQNLMEVIPNKIVNKLGIVTDVDQINEGGHDFIRITVRPEPKTVSLDGKVYYRSGASNQLLRGTALESFIMRKAKATWDGQIVPGATLDAIDPEAIQYFLRKGIAKGRLPKESSNDSIEKVLKNLEVMTEEGDLTIAALLLFGKSPQHYCLNARIKIGRFGQTQAALIAQDLIGGDLIRMADRVMETLDAKYLIRPIHYEGMQRIEPLELPEDGLREILYNAICHKDYQGPDSLMRVFDDRITFWNQGTLPSGITPESIFQPHDSHPRNRLIANAFYMAGFVEAWGRGYELISEAFKAEGLEVPTLVEAEGGVRVTIKRELFYAIQQGGRIDPKTGRLIKANDTKDEPKDEPKNLSERQRLIINLIPFGVMEDGPKNEPITTMLLVNNLGISRSTVKRELKLLQEFGFIEHVGPSNGGYWKRLK